MPTVGVEIAPRRVTAVAVARRGKAMVVAAHATEPLPPGAVVPGLTAANITDRPLVAGVVRRVLGGLGVSPRRIGLVVPDSLAKVSILRFDTVPSKADDLDRLVRWQVRKTAPFRIEDAQVAYSAGAVLPDGGREFIVTAARRDIVEEYETVCADAGAYAGLVDLASLNLVNVVLASSAPGAPRDAASDWLLVHVTPEYSTMAIVRGHDLVFFRNRRAEGEGDLADMVHQTAMYYEDRLGGGRFDRVILAGAASSGGARSAAEAEALRRTLESRVGGAVEPVDPRGAAAFTDRISAGAERLDAVASPLGLLLREAA